MPSCASRGNQLNTDRVLTMYAVSTWAEGAGISVGAARKLFSGKYVSNTPNRGCDVTADSRRFLMVRVIDGPPGGSPMMVLVENWFGELTRRVPVH
jgi:hypothetical protein